MSRSLLSALSVLILLSMVSVHLFAARRVRVSLDTKPCDKLASETTERTLRRLATYTSDRKAGILSGQNVGFTGIPLSTSYRQMWTKLAMRKCPEPAVMTVDLATEMPSDTRVLNRLFREHFRKGGFVGIAMHPPNPWTGGDSWDCDKVSFQDLTKSGTRANRRYRKWVSDVADIVDELQERNVTVLWRPLHEANGDWFWWCYGGKRPRITPKQYQLLWRSMHDYFHRQRKLHNVLWVYSPNALTGDEVVRFDTAYPGKNFVDIVSLDYYGSDLNDLKRRGAYDTLRRFGKVMALAEYGSKPWNGRLDSKAWLKKIRGNYPHFAYFCAWHSWPSASVALADLDEGPALLNDSFVINLEDAARVRSKEVSNRKK